MCIYFGIEINRCNHIQLWVEIASESRILKRTIERKKEKKNVFNLGDSWYYKLWVEPCTTVLLFLASPCIYDDVMISSTMHFLNGIAGTQWTWINLEVWYWVCVSYCIQCQWSERDEYRKNKKQLNPTYDYRVNEEE